MKLSMLFILVGILQARADVRAQGSITLNAQQMEISKVLKKIESKGDFRFLYNYDLPALKKKVDVNFQNSDLKEALARLFSSTNLTYKVLDNKLIVVLASDMEKQAIRVTGTVTGVGKEPLPGVSVQVKGGSGGTSTDAKGSYSITVDQNATLIFSYIGYQDKEVAVSGQNIVDVVMMPSEKALDQVVVVGYGSQKRKDITGAVSTVTAADIANRPIVDASEALQGKAAGVQVTSNSGKPGAGLSIRVRGSSSISAGNDPLYIIDGIPTTDASSVNPNDIESFSVLKDAASAAIYGSRAANGVIVITTKKGVAGKSKMDFSTYYGITSPTKVLKVLNAQQYQSYANEVEGTSQVTDAMVAANDINWPKEVFQKGHQENYQLSFAGGSDKSTHFISVGYTDQKGIVKPASYDRFSSRVNLTNKATDWLTIITSNFITYSHQRNVNDNLSVAKGGVVLSALETPPTIPKYMSVASDQLFGLDTVNNPPGAVGFNPITGWDNPYGAIYGNYAKNRNARILSNVGADIKLLKGLTYQARFAVDYQDNLYQYFLDPFLTIYGRQTQGQQNETRTNNLTWLSEQTLNYNATWGRSHFSALAGWTVQESHTETTTLTGSFLKDQYRLLDWDATYYRDSVKAPGTNGVDDWGLVSYLGRLTYDFDGKYLFQANLRSDESSKFASGNRTATFPSFSAGWRISKEDFMQNVSWLNDLKLRAGWGQNGNQEGIGSYEYLPLSTINPADASIATSTIAPKSLKWETSTQTDVGVDATALGNRITFSADFYYKKTRDILVNIPLPSQAGYPFAPVNGASMRNVGEEFQLSTKNIVHGSVRWTTDFNLSFNQNKVLTLPAGLTYITQGYGNTYARGSATILTLGRGLGQFIGYVAKGVDPQTGHELYVGKDGKSLVDSPQTKANRQILGSAQPKFVYGLTNTVSWKNFDLTVFVQGSYGNKILNYGRLELEAENNAANQSDVVAHRWEKPGDITDIPGVKLNDISNSVISTRFLESGSYLRFKTITLSYKVDPAIASKLGLAGIQAYVSGNNLITITKYKGFDPEVNSYGDASNTSDNRNVSLGIDNGAYPQSKMILFGLNLSFK
jgi:TonB-linked SusC/RagA family outer membrane protein